MAWTLAPFLPEPWCSLGLTVPQISIDMGRPKRTVTEWIQWTREPGSDGSRYPREESRAEISQYFTSKGIEPPNWSGR